MRRGEVLPRARDRCCTGLTGLPWALTIKGIIMADHDKQAEHTKAEHTHGENCGHNTVEHGDHVDYLHDFHRHAEHEDHYDEYG